MQWIKEMFSDSKGQVSSLRMIHFLTYMIFMITWSCLCINHKELLNIPNEWLVVLGGLQVGKHFQKKIEESKIHEKN